MFVNRAFGDYAWSYWIMVSCNVITPQLIWIRAVRRSPFILFILSIFVNIGMWFERFVIVVTSLHHDFLPSSWDYVSPKLFDFTTFIGSFGLFFTMFCLFARFLPMVAIAESKAVLPIANPHYVDPSRTHARKHERDPGESRSGQVDSKHDLDDSEEAPVVSEVSVSQSSKVVVNKPPPEPDDDEDVEDRDQEDEEDEEDVDPDAHTRPLRDEEELSSKAIAAEVAADKEPAKESSGDFTFAPPKKKEGDDA